MGDTSIQWTDKTWSPLRVRVKKDAAIICVDKGYQSLVKIARDMAGHVGPHCEHVSHGCDHCYSDTNNGRCLPSNGTGLPFDRRTRDLVDPFVDEKILLQPLKWRKPVKVFVENQSDLFGEWVTDKQIDRVFAVMALCPQHVFQCLTKRPERMLAYIRSFDNKRIDCVSDRLGVIGPMSETGNEIDFGEFTVPEYRDTWPLPNVWLGVSLEDQKTADARIPLLLQTPAAVRFVSYEPALGPVDFHRIAVGFNGFSGQVVRTWDSLRGTSTVHDPVFGAGGVAPSRLDWIIVGGESGPGARPFDTQWARQTIEQCREAGVACFVKQLGRVPIMPEAHWREQIVATGKARMLNALNAKHTPNGFVPLSMQDRKGGSITEWPEDLRVREFPKVAGA